eukprot:jgi/Chrzof1/3865/Cz13g11190.t1
MLRCVVGRAGALWHVEGRRARNTPYHCLRKRSCILCSASSPVTQDDRRYMRQALELAKRALGKTHPNPAVGCVLVKDDKVVGEGYHPKAGMPHAEVYALRAAGQAARGATAYVTLEPCNHYGRTPPCSRALVDAGISKVVIGVGDPNPLVASAGIATLQSAGIVVAVIDGDESEQCYSINEEFMQRMQASSRPQQTDKATSN